MNLDVVCLCLYAEKPLTRYPYSLALQVMHCTYPSLSIYLLPSPYPYIGRSAWRVPLSQLVFVGVELYIRQLAVAIILALLENGSPGLVDPSLAEHPQYPSPDHFGFHAVNDGIQDGWSKEMEVGCESIHLGRHVFAKPVHHGEADHGDKEEQDSTDMGDAVVEGFQTLSPSCKVQDGLKDQKVGQEHKEQVQTQCGE